MSDKPAFYEGDSWKSAKAAPVVVNLKRRTRAEAQAHMDDQYRKGEIGLDQWRFASDVFSEPGAFS